MSDFKRTMQNNMKWQERKNITSINSANKNTANDCVTGDNTNKFSMFMEKTDEPLSEKERILNDLERMYEDQQRSAKLAAIDSKLITGKRLSKKEMSFLKEHAPFLYEKAAMAERERVEYEREIRNARSKEEVDKINQRKMQQFKVEARAVKSSNMPLADKKEAIKFIQMRMSAVMDSHMVFVQSKEYMALPDSEDDEKRVSVPVFMRERLSDFIQVLIEFRGENKTPDFEEAEVGLVDIEG
jgi:hypothetical protein